MSDEIPHLGDVISHTHAHGNTLDEEHGNDPTPHHTRRPSISHAIVQGTGERGKQAEDGEADAEGRP